MDRKRLQNEVKIKLEEIHPDEDIEVINSPLIDSLLNESTDEVQLLAPIYLLDATEHAVSTNDQVENTDNTGYIVLPDDFLRLVSFKMSVWKRAVTQAISEENPLYNKQKNTYTRGGIAKPVAVIRFEPSENNRKVLEYYSVTNNNHNIDRLLYVDRKFAENLQDDLVDPLTWICASKVLDVMEQPELGAVAYKKATDFMQLRVR